MEVDIEKWGFVEGEECSPNAEHVSSIFSINSYVNLLALWFFHCFLELSCRIFHCHFKPDRTRLAHKHLSPPKYAPDTESKADVASTSELQTFPGLFGVRISSLMENPCLLSLNSSGWAILVIE